MDFISIRQVRNLRQGADPRDFKTLRSARHQPHEDAEGPATPAPRARVSGCEAVLSTPSLPAREGAENPGADRDPTVPGAGGPTAARCRAHVSCVPETLQEAKVRGRITGANSNQAAGGSFAGTKPRSRIVFSSRSCRAPKHSPMPADHPTKTVGGRRTTNGMWARQRGNATTTRSGTKPARDQ